MNPIALFQCVGLTAGSWRLFLHARHRELPAACIRVRNWVPLGGIAGYRCRVPVDFYSTGSM